MHFHPSLITLLFTERWRYARVRSPSARTRMKWHRYFGLATVFTLSRSGWILLIQVLGLRGCGRRQVLTCACRINLQLHSRPLSPTPSSSSRSSLQPSLHDPLVLSPFHAPFLPSSFATLLDYILFCLFSLSEILPLSFLPPLSTNYCPIYSSYYNFIPFFWLSSHCHFILCLFIISWLRWSWQTKISDLCRCFISVFFQLLHNISATSAFLPSPFLGNCSSFLTHLPISHIRWYIVPLLRSFLSCRNL